MKNLKITTSLLAKICNVSQGTVDRALNNRSDINPETKQKILDVAKQYGYRENIEMQETKIYKKIGIIVFNLNNEYFSKLITEIEYILRTIGYSATVMMSHYDKQYEIECIRNLYNMGVDGIILCSVNSGLEFDNYLRLFDIPIVAVGNPVGAVPFVSVDDYLGMKDMTEHILEKGYKNIIYFSPAVEYDDAFSQKIRYNGFLGAIKNHPFTLVTNINMIEQEYPDNTAIICSTDYYALQVYFKTKNAHISGFDNIDILDKYKIKIDSVAYSMTEIAKIAVDILIGIKRDKTIVKHYIVSRS